MSVAPLVGAWIEIFVKMPSDKQLNVAPLVGAWIEIYIPDTGSPPRTGSLPSWERGLKSYSIYSSADTSPSLPSWERGLKSTVMQPLTGYELSLPSWERGLKYVTPAVVCQVDRRSPRGSVD